MPHWVLTCDYYYVSYCQNCQILTIRWFVIVKDANSVSCYCQKRLKMEIRWFLIVIDDNKSLFSVQNKSFVALIYFILNYCYGFLTTATESAQEKH